MCFILTIVDYITAYLRAVEELGGVPYDGRRSRAPAGGHGAVEDHLGARSGIYRHADCLLRHQCSNPVQSKPIQRGRNKTANEIR